jgi:DNA transposition AAA+ family ATPase
VTETVLAHNGQPASEYINDIRKAVKRHSEATGVSQAEIARGSGVSSSTLSEFLRNTYRGNMLQVAETLEKWVGAETDKLEHSYAVISDPPFIETSLAKQVLTALRYAHVSPSMAVVTLGSGLGKTVALKHYAATHLHAYRVVIRPTDSRPNRAMRAIGRMLGLGDIMRLQDMTVRISERLKREGGRQTLLMIDEAQHLSEESVNELRFLLDEFQCGLALVGNEDLMRRYRLQATREGFGQIHRRIGTRVDIRVCPPTDVDLILNAMGVSDPELRRLSHQVALRPGGIGQMVDTLKLASVSAYGHHREVTAGDLKAAWSNRSQEDIR